MGIFAYLEVLTERGTRPMGGGLSGSLDASYAARQSLWQAPQVAYREPGSPTPHRSTMNPTSNVASWSLFGFLH